MHDYEYFCLVFFRPHLLFPRNLNAFLIRIVTMLRKSVKDEQKFVQANGDIILLLQWKGIGQASEACPIPFHCKRRTMLVTQGLARQEDRLHTILRLFHAAELEECFALQIKYLLLCQRRDG